MASVDLLADEIDRLSRRLIRNTECCDRMLVARCELTPSQAYTLQTLEDQGEVPMSALAEEMRLHGTTMTRMVDALVEKGLVERASDPEDRRVVRVRLSPVGQEAVAELRRCKREFLAAVMQAVPEEELRAIMSGLRRLVALAEQWGACCCGR